MRFMKAAFAVAMLVATSVANAQSTTGTISGRVVDAQQLSIPGVTVNAESPNLQGIRTTVTSENGDYIIPLLPSGAYKVSFELSGFQRQERSVTLAPTQVLPVDIVMGPATLSETVEVVGRKADVLTQTAQVATNFTQELIATLPTNRDINATLLLAPAVHPTGPNGANGAYSISGAASFESLFMVNGVAITENLRGTPYDLYVEDAIQETTVATAGVSAEFGRFGGGLVNVITKSGGNLFSGSFRDTLNNDKWRTLTPFETPLATDPRIEKTVPAYEYVLGGPVVKDRLWFFTTGRIQSQESGRTLVGTTIPYIYTDKTQRYEGKVTYSASAAHRFQGDYLKISQDQLNYTFNTNASMDRRSLGDRSLPENLFTMSYNGILSNNFFIEARYSTRSFTFKNSGAKSTDIIEGTLLLDQNGTRRYWSDTFCGICTPEERNNDDIYFKGTYFMSAKGRGTHTVVFGYDRFNDVRQANNHQSGSDYRIYGSGLPYVVGENVIPRFLGDDTTIIQYNPIPIESQGSSFQTHSLFVNDAWRLSSNVTANLGIRWDKNHGEDQTGNLVAQDSAFSPRLGVVWDPNGQGEWSITGSFSKYVAAISNSIADSASAAGNPQQYQYYYRGPAINATSPTVPTADAIRMLFAWYDANPSSRVLASNPTLPGLTPQVRDSLNSPNAIEYAAGVSRNFGAKAAIRADFTYRKYGDFYVSRIDGTTGRVTNSLGQSFDLELIENDTEDLLKRNYKGGTVSGSYRFTSRIDVGGNYTLSQTRGNSEGENVGSGPTASAIYRYPEYKQASWNYPEGDLQVDERHRTRLWVNVGVPKVNGLTLSVMQSINSGVPYGASNLTSTNFNGVNPRPYVTGAPNYVNPPTGQNTIYFFTARDAFRTETEKRTDFAANYSYRIAGAHNLELFAQAQVLNMFNQFQLCGCGGTVFQNGGGVTLTRIDTTVRTAVTNPTLYTTFNPFTTSPVRGVNWDYGPVFGTALNRFAYTQPRQFRVSFGVRF